MADNLDADKLAVLAALLAKEEERRFKEKFEKGEVVIVTGVPDADDDEGKVTLKADKAPSVDDFSARRRVSEALNAVAKPMPTSPPPASGFEEPAEPLEEHHIYVQVAPPTENDPGAIIEGSYSAYGGTVRVYDADGHLLGVEHTDANAAAVARRLLRAKKSPGFWAPINYTAH
jgi:hypothetical protein